MISKNNIKLIVMSAMSLMSTHATKLPTNNIAQTAIENPVSSSLPGIKIVSTPNKYGSGLYLHRGTNALLE